LATGLLKSELARRGREPAAFGRFPSDTGRSHTWFSTVIDGPRVAECWCYWIDGAITVHVLTAAGYEPRPRSQVLPDLDLDVVVELIDCPTINQLVARMQTYARSLR
jgi:hypothetical protein